MDQNDTTRRAVILGALLHDIGKLIQRAQKNPREQRHTSWGEKWFDKNFSDKLTPMFDIKTKQIVSSAIGNHHEYEEYITLADAISAGMERIPLKNEEEGDPFTDRLISALSRISISNKRKEDRYHKLALLGETNFEEVFPETNKNNPSEDYVGLLDRFNDEVESLNFTRSSPLQVIEQIYFLLWKYTWCIPSAAYHNEPDVSLFDHLKTTAAITACLYDYKNEGNEINIDGLTFQLIGGDISGIQAYIFEVLTQQGKVAKRLRARSLFIQLLSEIASHKILHAFSLPLCNLIISAGGNFYILVPNIKDARNRLDKLQTEFDNWTLKELRAELSIHLASSEISGKELRNFSKVSDQLKNKLSHKKYQPHKSVLLSEKNGQ